MRILVLSPHPDDESIGCGGSLALHHKTQDSVSVVYLTSGERGIRGLEPLEAQRIREREAASACSLLGVQDQHFLRFPDGDLAGHLNEIIPALKRLLCELRPDMIYSPHPKEWHPDHRATAQALGLALNQVPTSRVLAYEVWTPLEHYQVSNDISSVMNEKIRAIRCHSSQLQEIPYDSAAEGLSRYRGAFAYGGGFAEVFGLPNT